ncbi:MAG TPA: BBE domain-containing protein, partial [Mycobacterium sp.]|nr:BBE domain-containing protein [Mycobacterium sp.]
TLVECFQQVPSAMTFCIIESMGGAAARVASTATAYPHRAPGYSLFILTQWRDPSDTPDNIGWARDTFEALRPHMSDRRYMNYMSGDDAGYVHDAYGSNYERLVEVKQTYDPDNVFHLNQNIRPR